MKIQIADAELPIMKVLWEWGEQTSPEIFSHLNGNVSTLKTLLKRLVDKGAVAAAEINTRTYRYQAAVSREDYVKEARQSFLQKVFDGSAEKMLLNFVKEEKISKEELQKLMELVEEE